MRRPTLRTRLPSPRERLPLGASGLRVSPYCIGFTRDPGVVLEAFDRGINFFFITADMHWPYYEGTRRGVAELLRARRGVRDDIVVGCVSYVEKPEWAVQPFLEVLQAVPELERIDLTIVGGVKGLQSEQPRFDAFARQRAERRVPGARAGGASFHDRESAVHMIAGGTLDIAFTRYNADHRGAECDLFPALQPERDTLVFNFLSTHGYVKPSRFPELGFDPASWRPDFTDHYRFVLTRPELDGLLCAPQTRAHVASLEEAVGRGPLTPKEVSYVKCVTDLHLGRIPTGAGEPRSAARGAA